MVKSRQMYFNSVSETLTPFHFNATSGYTKAASRHACLLVRLVVLEELGFNVGELMCEMQESCRPGEWSIFVAVWLKPKDSILARYVHPAEHHITICRLYGTHDRMCELLADVTHLSESESWRFLDADIWFPSRHTSVTGTCSLYPNARFLSICAAVAGELQSRFDALVTCFQVAQFHMQLHPATSMSGRTAACRLMSQRRYFTLVCEVYREWPELNPGLNPW